MHIPTMKMVIIYIYVYTQREEEDVYFMELACDCGDGQRGSIQGSLVEWKLGQFSLLQS